MNINGCILNSITPFSDTNEIDFEKFDKIIEHTLKNNFSAVVFGRETGEFLSMDNDEILSVLEYAIKKIDNKLPIIAHTGLMDTRKSVELSVKAKNLGVKTIILSIPYTAKNNLSGIITHIRSIALSTGLDFYLDINSDEYTIEFYSKILEEVYTMRNFKGIIESGSDINKITHIVANLKNGIEFIGANDSAILSFLTLGAKSFISNVANICPKDVNSIYENFIKNNIALARDIHFSLLKLIEVLSIENIPVSLKTAMNMLGYDIGDFRLPLNSMDTDKAAQLATILMDMNIDK